MGVFAGRSPDETLRFEATLAYESKAITDSLEQAKFAADDRQRLPGRHPKERPAGRYDYFKVNIADHDISRRLSMTAMLAINNERHALKHSVSPNSYRLGAPETGVIELSLKRRRIRQIAFAPR